MNKEFKTTFNGIDLRIEQKTGGHQYICVVDGKEITFSDFNPDVFYKDYFNLDTENIKEHFNYYLLWSILRNFNEFIENIEVFDEKKF